MGEKKTGWFCVDVFYYALTVKISGQNSEKLYKCADWRERKSVIFLSQMALRSTWT